MILTVMIVSNLSFSCFNHYIKVNELYNLMIYDSIDFNPENNGFGGGIFELKAAVQDQNILILNALQKYIQNPVKYLKCSVIRK